MKRNKNNCPKCNSVEFVTELNVYEVMTFEDTDFIVQKRITIDEFKLFCRECCEEVDINKSEAMKKVCMVRKKRTSVKKKTPKKDDK